MTKPSRLYVPVYTNLPDHPKTRRLARLLGGDVTLAVGHLVRLWLWAQEYASDGDLAPFAPDEIAWACGYENDPAVLLRALEKSGFVADGCLHDWDTYAGKVRQQREQNAERQARWREKRLSGSDDNGNVTVTSRLVTRLEEEKEEEKEITPLTPQGGNERGENRSGYTAEFESFWAAYPRGRGDKLTAFKVWQRLSKQHRTDAESALPAWVACRQWREGYFPACSKWLRGRAWEDEPPADRRPVINGHAPKQFSPEDIASGRFTDQF